MGFYFLKIALIDHHHGPHIRLSLPQIVGSRLQPQPALCEALDARRVEPPFLFQPLPFDVVQGIAFCNTWIYLFIIIFTLKKLLFHLSLLLKKCFQI